MLTIPTIALCLALAGDDSPSTFAIRSDLRSPLVAFAEKELTAALRKTGRTPAESSPLEIEIAIDPSVGPESYETRPARDGNRLRIAVAGGDAAGAMYGVLDLAEALAAGADPASFEPGGARAAHAIRAFRVDVPLGPAPPRPDEEWVLDPAFWEGLLDALARDRFDSIAIFAPDPFAALAFEPARRVLDAAFAHAHARGIAPVLVATTLPEPAALRVSAGAALAMDGLRGVGVAVDAVRPSDPKPASVLRDGLLRAVAESGRKDVALLVGDRGFDPASLDSALAAAAAPVEAFVLVHFNGDHALASPRPHFFDPGWFGRNGARFRPIWNLRNDDVAVVPSGDPGTIRAAISGSLENGPAAGVLVGSSLFDPGPDTAVDPSEKAHVTWRYRFERMWYGRSLFGRLAHDPGTPDAVFERRFVERFGAENGKKLFDSISRASKAISLVAAYHFGARVTDYWPEANAGLTNSGEGRGFAWRDADPWHSTLEWIFTPTLDDDAMSIAEFILVGLDAKGDRGAIDTKGRTGPSGASDAIGDGAGEAHNAAYDLIEANPDAAGPLRFAILDLQALGHIGVSHSQRLRGALELALYLSSGDKLIQRRARTRIHSAWGQWKYAGFNAGGRHSERAIGPFGAFLPGARLDRADEDTAASRRMKADPEGWRALSKFLDGKAPPPGFDYRIAGGFFDFGVPGFDNAPIVVASGTTVVEAKSLCGAWDASSDAEAARGAACRSSGEIGAAARHRLVRRLRAGAPGTYVVWTRALRGGAGGSRSVGVRVGTTELPPTHAGGDASSGPELAWEKAGAVTLIAGDDAVLEVRDAGDGAEGIAAVLLTDVPGFEPR